MRGRTVAVLAGAAGVAVLMLAFSGCLGDDDVSVVTFTDVAAPQDPLAYEAYVASNGFSLARPTAATAQSRPLVLGSAAPVGFAIPADCVPDLGCPMDLGSFVLPAPATVPSDLAAELWLSSPQGAVLSGLKLTLSFDGTKAAVLSLQNDAVTPALRPGDGPATGFSGVLGPTARPFHLGGASILAGAGLLNVSAGTEVRASLAVWGVAANTKAAADVADVVLEYGSRDRPSGIVFTADLDHKAPPLGDALRLFLAPGALKPEAPATADDLTVDWGKTGASLPVGGVGAEWDWGGFVADQDYVGTGTGTLTLWTQLHFTGTANAAVFAGLRASLYVTPGTAVAQGQAGTYLTGTAMSVLEATAARAAFKLVVPLPVAGLRIPAGSRLDLRLQAFGFTDSTVGDLQVYYGSARHPSGLMLPVLTSGAIVGDQPPPTPVLHEAATNATVLRFAQSYANWTSDIYVLRWLGAPARVAASYNVTVRHGALGLLLRDPGGAEHAVNFTKGPFRHVNATYAGGNGTWELVVNYTGFRGDVALALAAAPTPPGTANGTAAGVAGPEPLAGPHPAQPGQRPRPAFTVQYGNDTTGDDTPSSAPPPAAPAPAATASTTKAKAPGPGLAALLPAALLAARVARRRR